MLALTFLSAAALAGPEAGKSLGDLVSLSWSPPADASHRRAWINGLQSKRMEQVVSVFLSQNLAASDGVGVLRAALIIPVQKHSHNHGTQLQQRFSKNGHLWPGGGKRRPSGHYLEAFRCIGRAAAGASLR